LILDSYLSTKGTKITKNK